MWFAVLVSTALATCSAELDAEPWLSCWTTAAGNELPDEDAKAFAAQWRDRPKEARALFRTRLGSTDEAWRLGQALVVYGLDHSLAEAVLDAGAEHHDARLAWYSGRLADRVWDAWVAAEQRYVKEPTDPNRAMADAARTMKNVFYDHVLALRRTGADPSKALERCMAYVGVDTYCGDIEPGERTHNGW